MLLGERVAAAGIASFFCCACHASCCFGEVGIGNAGVL